MSRTKPDKNEEHRIRVRLFAGSALAGSTIVALCLASASRHPMEPLRVLARWSLERRGARFLPDANARLQSSLDDCGPTALADLLELSGLPVPSPAKLRRLSATTEAGTTLGDLGIAARKAGLPVFSLRWSPVDLAQLPLPSLVWVERRHFVVIARRSDGDSLEVHDPAAGHYRMSADRFTTLWSGAALIPLENISRGRGSVN